MTDAERVVELALDARAELGEGPVWDPHSASLFFVDILRGRVHRFHPKDGGTRSYEIGQPVGAIVLCERGDLLLAVQNGFARLDPGTGRVTMVAHVEADLPDRRMNDGKCDRAGRFWAGTMAFDERRGAGSLYRLDPDGRVHTILRDVTISNGLDWTADGAAMYYVDSGAGTIDLFECDRATGEISNRRVFARIASADGAPDGLTLDANGFVWVALWGGGAVRRYAPDGSLDRVVDLPTRYPTSCTFGGDDLGDLYITTAAVKLTPAERERDPRAGGLFRHRPGVRGRAAHRFRG